MSKNKTHQKMLSMDRLFAVRILLIVLFYNVFSFFIDLWA